MIRPKLNLLAIDGGSGRPVPCAWLSIYHANTLTLALLYADDAVSTVANPVQANDFGQVSVRVNAGFYDVAMTWNGSAATIVEDVLAWVPELSTITTPGDLIVGNAQGQPSRLPKGGNASILAIIGGTPTWSPLGGGVGMPPGPSGALLHYEPADVLAALPPGTEGQGLFILGGLPTWATHLPDPPGSLLPISVRGDLVVGSATGTPAQLSRGLTGQLLSVEADGDLAWINPPPPPTPGFSNPMTTAGDLIIGGPLGEPGRLALGADQSVLTVVGGSPTWTPLPVRRIAEVLLPLEIARLPDGSSGNAQPRPYEYVSTGLVTPNTGKAVAYAYAFLPNLRENLFWRVTVPNAYAGGAIECVLKWGGNIISAGQFRVRVSFAPIAEGAVIEQEVFNTATNSAVIAMPLTSKTLVTTRVPLDPATKTGVVAGVMTTVMVGLMEGGTPAGEEVFLQQVWLEFAT